MNALLSAISQRATHKVLAPEPWEATLSAEEQEALLEHILKSASFAPYHYPTTDRYKNSERGLTSELPFRMYTLNSATCRSLAEILVREDLPAGKVVNMLWAAEVMIAVSWLPDVFGEQVPAEDRMMEPVPFVGNLRNMEHIAAAGAAIQNTLLSATELGHLNYWSSGGLLRQKVVRDQLGIPMNEIMLGFLFVFPSDSEARGAIVKAGKNRDKGKALETWSQAVKL